MRIKKISQNTRDFNITDAITTGGTDLNEITFNQMQNNIENEIGNLKLRAKTITGLTLGAGSSYQLNLPAKAIWVEPLVECWGNNTAGGILVPIGGGAVYVVNNDKPITAGEYRGIWVTCLGSGSVMISDYRHNGLTVVGFRIWYLGTE